MAQQGESDDKCGHCVSFILERLDAHRKTYHGVKNSPPFFLGVNGVQGAGKTMLVSAIKTCLENEPHSLSTLVFSLDDFYLTHADQARLGADNSTNPLLQHRGQPSTHDVALASSVFSSLRQNLPTKIPQYDKSAFQGQGERVPAGQWKEVNAGKQDIAQIVIFEGWCVGFRALDEDELQSKWKTAVKAKENDDYVGRLGFNQLESLETINAALGKYDLLTNQLDAFIHLDAFDPHFVYDWRLEQESNLRAAKGSGMLDDQVRRFVDGYYPAYELYTEVLRNGIFDDKGRQLRIVLEKERTMRDVVRL